MKLLTNKEVLYMGVIDRFNEIKMENSKLESLGYRFKNDEPLENIIHVIEKLNDDGYDVEFKTIPLRLFNNKAKDVAKEILVVKSKRKMHFGI